MQANHPPPLKKIQEPQHQDVHLKQLQHSESSILISQLIFLAHLHLLHAFCQLFQYIWSILFWILLKVYGFRVITYGFLRNLWCVMTIWHFLWSTLVVNYYQDNPNSPLVFKNDPNQLLLFLISFTQFSYPIP